MNESIQYPALPLVFGAEWDALTERQKDAVALDLLTAEREGEPVTDLAEYRQNIGRGNLASYADVMLARFARIA